MFWILRRTGAANFFNSINSNYSSKSNANNNNNSEKPHSRPPRKEYGRLSVEDDSTSLHNLQTEQLKCTDARLTRNNNNNNNGNGSDPFAVANRNDDNCNMIHPHHHHHHQSNGASHQSTAASSCTKMSKTAKSEVGINGNGTASLVDEDNEDGEQQHIEDNDNRRCNYETGDSSDTELERTLRANRMNNRCYTDQQTTISRLQAMALSDEDDYDESLTCNVCDRAFHCHRQLASHQQKKRHFGCSGCDSLFPSLMLLEHHKEEFEHWSDVDDDTGHQHTCCRRGRGRFAGDDFTDTDSITSDAESEDLERLL